MPSFIGHPCDLTLRPTQQVSLHAHTPLFPSQSARPWAAAPSQLLSMELTLACNASQICRWHTVHTVSGACDGPYCMHNIHIWLSGAVFQCAGFWQQGGGARHGAPGGIKCSLDNGGSGILSPRARSGCGAELSAKESLSPAWALRCLRMCGQWTLLTTMCSGAVGASAA